MAEFENSKFGSVALFIAVGEPILIWVSVGVLYATHSAAPPWLARGLRQLYALGLCAVVLAILGTRKDSSPRKAAIALVLSLLNLVVCVIPIVG